MDTLQQLHHDLKLAEGWGINLEKPPTHFVRLLDLFAQEEREQMLSEAYDFYRTIESGRYSLDQFVTYFLTTDMLNQNMQKEGFIEPVNPLELKNIHTIGRDSVSPEFYETITATCQGRHARGLAYVLCNTLIHSFDSMSQFFIERFAKTLEKPIDRPELAAAVSRGLSFNEQLISTFRTEARALADYAEVISFEESTIQSEAYEDAEYDPKEVNDLAKRVGKYAESEDITNMADVQSKLKCRLDLAEKFKFIETPYGLLVPNRVQSQIRASFSNLAENVRRDKSHLLNLSPRQFEEFMAHLFSNIGFEVELTQQTRDGGADIICVRNLSGIPFRLAVELKRYREDRPISVNLIRSFVGANAQFNANRLVFVTTSNYTRPAIDFADNYAKHLLSLKGYDQIREWCDEASRDSWKLL